MQTVHSTYFYQFGYGDVATDQMSYADLHSKYFFFSIFCTDSICLDSNTFICIIFYTKTAAYNYHQKIKCEIYSNRQSKRQWHVNFNFNPKPSEMGRGREREKKSEAQAIPSFSKYFDLY